ncbi:enkurin-like [Diachasmimorpha longicaudata]|uniref:enkurin-like n=1 Tax=Diachasmimorpha longicaudata TaxID=58733 RepID=UPI0030B90650
MAFDFEESITQLIRQPSVQYNPPPRYISKFRDSVRSASKEGKSSHKTLGVPNVRLRSPSEFLRKKSRLEIKRDDINHKHYHIPNYQHKLPLWEKIKSSKKGTDTVEDAEKDKSPHRNFAKRNIINAMKLQPRKPRMYYVDDRRGSSYPLIPSGLYPLYRDHTNSKKSMGKKSVEEKGEIERPKISFEDKKILSGIEGQPETPARAEANDRKTLKILEADSTVAETSKASQPTESVVRVTRNKEEEMCRYVSDEERADLLYGMKKKFEELMHAFQVLPFLTDTPPKAKRKAKMERDLNQLEKDIDLIERHPRIYVYEGNP